MIYVQKLEFLINKFGIVKNSLYICNNYKSMKNKQIQSYISEQDYNELKKISQENGLLFATLIRQILINYLKDKKNGSMEVD